ncbi:TerC family protein [Geobacillus thermodenitrificans]|jgi:YjbE family integral membrane protein|uniref:Integral membrane protein n=1 Tax=Geobacillus thermodenitrificans (strain NG80-2) TaxID=420246 RepID=A4IL74_GEOTN|nr:TerC family protein [Geobacillus thermodenitrificans]ABO66078.1 Integral membrane protein [Geobacillus thermodenitrificans NG80-2]ARP41810.1 putative membrane protein YkoY [Geobacillus thermodenitrificans]MED3717569.1 TerC family protein [Geobacillus thermodenitrificans]
MVDEYIVSILLIIGIDVILGGDNAVVIALASRNLPEQKRNIAIVLGTALAIAVRILLTAAVVWLLTIPFLQLVGGLILFWISLKLIRQKDEKQAAIKAEPSLWKAVRTIVVADVVMGMDNVIAIAGAAQGHLELVVFGFLCSVPIIILGSKIILYAMERFPPLIYIGGALLAYTAGKMIAAEEQLRPFYDPRWELFFPLSGAILAVLLGFAANRRTRTVKWR